MLEIVFVGHQKIECYGELQDNSNIQVICGDEWQDDVWMEGNTDTDQPFQSWQEAAEFLTKLPKFDSGIFELSAI